MDGGEAAEKDFPFVVEHRFIKGINIMKCHKSSTCEKNKKLYWSQSSGVSPTRTRLGAKTIYNTNNIDMRAGGTWKAKRISNVPKWRKPFSSL